MSKRPRPAPQRDSSPDSMPGLEGMEERDSKGRPKLPRPEGKAACPRCNSLDTKFCYYNNYNIKQPRFYCKACARYWTSGGTLRNIPAGSGRRKTKAATQVAKPSACLTERIAPAAAQQPSAYGGLAPSGPAGSYGGLNPALLAAAADATGLLTNSAAAAAAYAHHQYLGHGGMGGLRLPGVAQWPGSGLQPDLDGSGAMLRGHLQAHLGAGPGAASALAHQASISSLDARLLLGHHDELVAQAHAACAPSSLLQQQQQQQPRHGSPSPSPPPQQQQQQLSSPQPPASQLSQQPSQPHPQQYGSPLDEADGLDDGSSAQVRRVRARVEADGGSVGLQHGMGGSLSLSAAQLVGLSMPPSMASLAAVMGPGGGPSCVPQLLPHPDDGSAAGLLEAHGLARHHLQMALQQQQQQQQGSMALHVQQHQQLLAELAAQQLPGGGVGLPGGGSAAAAMAALDLLHPGAMGLGGMGGWLQGVGGGGLPMSAATLDALHAHSLGSAAAGLMQHAQPSAAEVAAADWLSLASGGAAKGQGAAAMNAMVAAQAAGMGAVGYGMGGSSAAAQMYQMAAAGSGGWPSAPGGASMAGTGPSPYWSGLWTSYNSPPSSSYAGYALQAAAAAAYSGAR